MSDFDDEVPATATTLRPRLSSLMCQMSAPASVAAFNASVRVGDVLTYVASAGCCYCARVRACDAESVTLESGCNGGVTWNYFPQVRRSNNQLRPFRSEKCWYTKDGCTNTQLPPQQLAAQKAGIAPLMVPQKLAQDQMLKAAIKQYGQDSTLAELKLMPPSSQPRHPTVTLTHIGAVVKNIEVQGCQMSLDDPNNELMLVAPWQLIIKSETDSSKAARIAAAAEYEAQKQHCAKLLNELPIALERSRKAMADLQARAGQSDSNVDLSELGAMLMEQHCIEKEIAVQKLKKVEFVKPFTPPAQVYSRGSYRPCVQLALGHNIVEDRLYIVVKDVPRQQIQHQLMPMDD